MPLFPNLAIMLTGHNNNGFQKFESGSWSILCSSDKQKNFCLSELQKILNNHNEHTVKKQFLVVFKTIVEKQSTTLLLLQNIKYL